MKSLHELTEMVRATLKRTAEVDPDVIDEIAELLADAYAKGWEDSRYGGNA